MRLYSVLILDDSFSLSDIGSLAAGAYDAIVCLFWTATETIARLEQQTGARCIPLKQVVENVSEWERETTEAVINLCEQGPRQRGVPWRSYLRQSLFHELLYWYLAKRTLAFLHQTAGGQDETVTVELAVTPRLATALELQNRAATRAFVLKRSPRLVSPAPLPRRKRILRRIQEVMLLGGWRLEGWQLVSELDREYRWRVWHHSRIPASAPTGAITFFSSYFNNSRTQSVFTNYVFTNYVFTKDGFAKHLPAPMHWVFINWSAREGAENIASAKAWLWQFAPAHVPDALPTDDLPSTGEPHLDEWLGASQVWQDWLGFELRALARLTWCWENYLVACTPRLIVTASGWGLDGWLSRIAQTYEIPTVELLHGALGGYFYTKAPIEADVLVVWGEFWRHLLESEERAKILVFCPPELFPQVEKRQSEVRRLTFFSWSTAELPQYSASELTEGILRVLHELAQNPQVQITVRLHPAEKPSDLIQHWQKNYGALPKNLRLSKREPLNEILAETDVALMFRSTVMLNCLRNGIPIVMPGWIDFAWNDELMGREGIYLARGFADLFAQLEMWLQEPPSVTDSLTYFVDASRSAEDFVAALADLVLDAKRTPEVSPNGVTA